MSAAPPLQRRALFREVNHRIREVNERFAALHGNYEVLCECGRDDCMNPVEVSPAAYEDVRHSADRFIVASGHEHPALESVLADYGTYRVVALRAAGA